MMTMLCFFRILILYISYGNAQGLESILAVDDVPGPSKKKRKPSSNGKRPRSTAAANQPKSVSESS